MIISSYIIKHLVWLLLYEASNKLYIFSLLIYDGYERAAGGGGSSSGYLCVRRQYLYIVIIDVVHGKTMEAERSYSEADFPITFNDGQNRASVRPSVLSVLLFMETMVPLIHYIGR